MPTLLQRAETFVINTTNPVAKQLVYELRERVVELERQNAALLHDLNGWRTLHGLTPQHHLDVVATTGGKATTETR
jgi:hypothetical protein